MGTRSAAARSRPAVRRPTRAQERRRLLALWLMALSPLAVLPGGFDRFVFPKLLVVAVACLVATTLPGEQHLPRSITLTLVVGAAVFTVAALVGETPLASLVGRWPRYEGLPVLGLYAASVWLGARVVGRGLIRAVHLGHALAGMSLALFGFSLLDVLGHPPLGRASIERSGSLLGNATDQGLVAMMAAVVLAGVLVLRPDPWVLAGGAAAVATVAFSASRIAMALTVVAVAAVLLRGPGRPGRPGGPGARPRVLGWLVGAVALLGTLALLVPLTRGRLLDPTTGTGRLTQWRLTLDLVADHPWLGLGGSRYLDVFGRYESAGLVRFTGARTLADSPHDLLLQTAVAGGLPLLACLTVLVVLVVRRGLVVVRDHPESWAPAVAATAYGVAMLANFTAAGATCLAAFLAGAVLAEPTAAADAARRERTAAWAASAVFGGAVAALAVSCAAEVGLAHGITQTVHHHPGAARHDLLAAQRLRPLDGDIAMLGAKAMAGLADQGDRRAARATVDLAERALERTPSSYDARVALAVGLIARGDLGRARSVLDAAVASFPYRPDAFVQRAIARYGLGDRAGARADLEVALRIQPRSIVTRRLLQRIRG